jgi:L,D-transpeptidase YbiS
LRIVVKTEQQEMEVWDGKRLVRSYPVSTAKNGLGCEKGSYKTPTGKLRIAEKVGEDLELGAVLRDRVPTGEVWSRDPGNPLSSNQQDLILTRVLWLEGCEPHNANTKERCVYFHGTNQEHLIGQPVSHGCIRLNNRDMAELFNLVSEGTEVEVV